MQYLKDKQGTYQGVLKDPPLPVDHKDVEDLLGSNLIHKPLYGMRMSEFPDCCGIKVLNHFENFPSMIACGTKTSEAQLSACVYTIDKLFMTNNILKTDNYNATLPIGKKYVLVAINKDQASGIGALLVDYFGFVRLEDDFLNYGESDNITILGLRFSDLSPGGNVL